MIGTDAFPQKYFRVLHTYMFSFKKMFALSLLCNHKCLLEYCQEYGFRMGLVMNRTFRQREEWKYDTELRRFIKLEFPPDEQLQNITVLETEAFGLSCKKNKAVANVFGRMAQESYRPLRCTYFRELLKSHYQSLVVKHRYINLILSKLKPWSGKIKDCDIFL